MRLASGIFNVSYFQEMMVFRTRFHRVCLLIFLIFLFLIPLVAKQYFLDIVSTTAITVIALQGLNILSGYCGQISVGHSAFMAVGAYSSGILGRKMWITFLAQPPLRGSWFWPFGHYLWPSFSEG